MKKSIVILIVVFIGFLFLQAGKNNKTPETKEVLGQLLFFDPILSADHSVSCATCHKPAFAFADTTAVSTGVGGRKGKRNTPSAMNVNLHQQFFWDGRAGSLEEQALAPIENPDEMNLPLDVAIKRINADDRYRRYFERIFSSPATKENLVIAIAAFERTLETSASPFDKWKFSGEEDVVSVEVKRGFEIFNSKGKCSTCHFGADFTSNEFRNIGLFDGKKLNDSGRALITKRTDDIGKFKTPGLRNISVTAPYMHDGSFNTLEEVIRFYNDPEKIVPGSLNRDSLLIKPLGLTEIEMKDLEAFMISLTDSRFKEMISGRTAN